MDNKTEEQEADVSAFMPIYVGDYLKDTGHLSTIEHGAYTLLLYHMWKTGALTSDRKRLARICRMTESEFVEVWEVIQEFFQEEGQSITNRKLIEVRELSIGKRLKAVERAKKGAEARWKNDASSNAQAMPDKCESIPKHEPAEQVKEPENTELPQTPQKKSENNASSILKGMLKQCPSTSTSTSTSINTNSIINNTCPTSENQAPDIPKEIVIFWNKLPWTKKARFIKDETKTAFRKKVNTRIKKNYHLVDEIKAKLESSPHMAEHDWFDIRWIFESDRNLEKFLNGKYDRFKPQSAIPKQYSEAEKIAEMNRRIGL